MPATTKQKIVPDSFAIGIVMAIGISLFIYLLSGVLFPFIFLLPLPLLIFAYNRGFSAGLAATALVSCSLFFSAGGSDILPLITALGAGLAGSWIINILRKNPEAPKIGLILLLVPLVVVPSAMLGAEYLTGSSVKIYSQQVYVNLEQSVDTMMNEQGIAAGNREEIGKLMKNAEWMLTNLYPALFAAIAVIAVLISLAVADRYSPALMGVEMKWPKFRSIRLPEPAILLFVVSGSGVLLAKGAALFIFSNILAFTIFVFLIQGLALLSFLNHTFGIKPFMQTLIYLALLMIPFNIFVLSAFGMLDVWIPMRKKIEDLHHKLTEDFE